MAYKYITLSEFYLQKDNLLHKHKCYWQQPGDGVLIRIKNVGVSASPNGSYVVVLVSKLRRWPADNSLVAIEYTDITPYREGWLVELKDVRYDHTTTHIVISKEKSWEEIHELAELWIKNHEGFKHNFMGGEVFVWSISNIRCEVLIENKHYFTIYLARTPIFI